MASVQPDESKVVLPDELIRPSLTLQDATVLASRLYNIAVEKIKELDSCDDQNFYIATKSAKCNRREYIMKIMNSIDSMNAETLDAQTKMMIFLNEKGFHCPRPVSLSNGDYMTLEQINGKKGSVGHMVRLLDYVPGVLYKSVSLTNDLCYEAGQYIGRINMALKDFHHSGLNRQYLIWNLSNLPAVEKYVNVFDEEKKREILNYYIKAFKDHVIPNYSKFTKGAIHGDFNESNIIVAPDEVNCNVVDESGKPGNCKYKICGLIDFGDVQDNYYLFDAAIAIMYTMLQSKDPVTSGGYVLAGYLSIFPLSDLERELLLYCAAARICQSLALGMYTYSLHPDNQYLLLTQEIGWKVLELLYSMPKKKKVPTATLR